MVISGLRCSAKGRGCKVGGSGRREAGGSMKGKSVSVEAVLLR